MPLMTVPEEGLDPITAEIVRAGFVAITEEMKTNLMRTAYNMIIYEALRLHRGPVRCERQHRLHRARAADVHPRSLRRDQGEARPLRQRGIRPGDIMLTNDAYIMGSHLNHMIFTLPIFWEGELVAFSSSMAHWHDVGGTLARRPRQTSTRKGCRSRSSRSTSEGSRTTSSCEIIKTNVRFPDLAMGDFRAQIAAIRTGERRMRAMLDRYGARVLRASIADLFSRSEELARQAVRRIPDGEYAAEAYMDDDGVRLGQAVPIRVRVRVADDRMTVDLTDVSRRSPATSTRAPLRDAPPRKSPSSA